MLTAYHAKYFAHELTKRHSADDPEKLAGTLVDAQVDLNPHQVDAAMFAFGSPLSKGPCWPMRWDWAKRLRLVWLFPNGGLNENAIF